MALLDVIIFSLFSIFYRSVYFLHVTTAELVKGIFNSRLSAFAKHIVQNEAICSAMSDHLYYTTSKHTFREMRLPRIALVPYKTSPSLYKLLLLTHVLI